MDSNTRTALEIFSCVVRNIPVNGKQNSELFSILKRDSFVESELREIVDMFELDLYMNEEDGVFAVPKVQNKIFGYTNEELKAQIGLKNNTELYLCYFIVYCTISTFYIQNNFRTQAEYVQPISLQNKVNDRLKTLSENCDLGVEEQTSFKKLYTVWTNEYGTSSQSSKDTININDKRSKSQLALVNKTLTFLVDNKYMVKDEHNISYSITTRFEFIVERFFDESQGKLQDMLDKELHAEGLDTNEFVLNNK